jgi:hypothetical protein
MSPNKLETKYFLLNFYQRAVEIPNSVTDILQHIKPKKLRKTDPSPPIWQPKIPDLPLAWKKKSPAIKAMMKFRNSLQSITMNTKPSSEQLQMSIPNYHCP